MEAQNIPNFSELEEGEILNDDLEDLYTPLVRPHVSSTVTAKPIQPIESDDDSTVLRESLSDSDSSISNVDFLNVKPKKNCPNPVMKAPVAKKKKYNVWCSDLQDEVLTNSLTDCNIDQVNKRFRDVESYNFPFKSLSYKDNEDKNNFSSKIKHERNCSEKRKHVKTNSAYGDNSFNDLQGKNKDAELSYARDILVLSTSVNDSEEDIAKDIANKLYEEKEDLICRAINILGKEAVLNLFEETRKIEANGGLLVMNGTRRRTPGGVFFYLLKTSKNIEQDVKKLVLMPNNKLRDQAKKLAAKKMREMQAEKLRETLSKD